MDRGAEVPIDVELLAGEPILVLAEIVLERRKIDTGQIAVKEVPVHENAHALLELRVLFVDDAGFVKVLLLGIVNLAVILADSELFDDWIEVFLVHGAPLPGSLILHEFHESIKQ